jgi:hypothetical protein
VSVCVYVLMGWSFGVDWVELSGAGIDMYACTLFYAGKEVESPDSINIGGKYSALGISWMQVQ